MRIDFEKETNSQQIKNSLSKTQKFNQTLDQNILIEKNLITDAKFLSEEIFLDSKNLEYQIKVLSKKGQKKDSKHKFLEKINENDDFEKEYEKKIKRYKELFVTSIFLLHIKKKIDKDKIFTKKES